MSFEIPASGVLLDRYCGEGAWPEAFAPSEGDFLDLLARTRELIGDRNHYRKSDAWDAYYQSMEYAAVRAASGNIRQAVWEIVSAWRAANAASDHYTAGIDGVIGDWAWGRFQFRCRDGKFVPDEM